MLVQSSFLLLGAARIFHIQVEAWVKEVRRTARAWKKTAYRIEPRTQTTEAHLRHLLRKCVPVSTFTYPPGDAYALAYEPSAHVAPSCGEASLLEPTALEPLSPPPAARTDHLDTSQASYSAPQPELDLLLEAPTGDFALEASFTNDTKATSRLDLGRTAPPNVTHTDASYRALCHARRGAKRQRVCPLDKQIGYTPEEWAYKCVIEQTDPVWYTPWRSQLPPDPILGLCTYAAAHPGMLSSFHIKPLWTQTVEQKLRLLTQHFQNCTRASKEAWASRAHLSQDTEDALPPLEVSDMPPSPEVGRAVDMDELMDDQPLFPWSRLGETHIDRSTPTKRRESRTHESLSSTLPGTWGLPSPDISRGSFDLPRWVSRTHQTTRLQH